MKPIIKMRRRRYGLKALLYMVLVLASHALYAQYNSSNSSNQTYPGNTGTTQPPPATSQGNVYGQGPVTSTPGTSYEEPKPALNSKYVKTYKLPKPKAAKKTIAQEHPAGEADNTRVAVDTPPAASAPSVTTTTTAGQSASDADVVAVNTADSGCLCIVQNILFGLLIAAIVAFIILLSMYRKEKAHHDKNINWKT